MQINLRKLKELNRKNKLLLSISFLFLIILAVVVISIITNNNKIDLSNIYTITIDGLDTQGSASYQINKKDFETILISKNIDVFRADMFMDSLKCNLSKKENLKNGDQITATLTYDEAVAKQLNLAFKSEEKKINVSGLQKGKTIDIFKDIQVTYTGTSPKGNVSIVNNSTDSFASKVRFESSKEKVENGDKIKVTAIYDSGEAKNAKVLIPQSSKEYTVSGLPEYLRKSTQLSSQIIDNLNKSIEKSVKEDINIQAPFFINHIPNKVTSQAFTLGDNYSCQNVIPQKAYIVTEKDNSHVWFQTFKQNKYCIISSVDIYVNNIKVATTYVSTELADVIIKNGNVDCTSLSSVQRDTLEKAEQSIEDEVSVK